MERLARLLPFRQFGRLRHLRGRTPCAPLVAAQSRDHAVTQPALLPCADPAFAPG